MSLDTVWLSPQGLHAHASHERANVRAYVPRHRLPPACWNRCGTLFGGVISAFTLNKLIWTGSSASRIMGCIEKFGRVDKCRASTNIQCVAGGAVLVRPTLLFCCLLRPPLTGESIDPGGLAPTARALQPDSARATPALAHPPVPRIFAWSGLRGRPGRGRAVCRWRCRFRRRGRIQSRRRSGWRR